MTYTERTVSLRAIGRQYLSWTGVLLILAGAGAGTARAADDALQMATTQYTTDWNPVRTLTYPATIATDLVTEKLIAKRCIGIDTGTSEDFENVCLRQGAIPSQHGTVALRLSDRCAAGGRRLDAADVAFAVDEIAQTPINRYHQYGMRIDDNNRLRITRPSSPPRWLSSEIFGFPVLRKPSRATLREFQLFDQPGAFASYPIGPGSEELINKATGGVFAYERIETNSVRLQLRGGGANRAEQASMPNVRIGIVDRVVDLTDIMNAADRPDVVLALSTRINVRDDLYAKQFDPRLTSFTYFGFNFDSADHRQRTLMGDVEFRRLFTQSAWTAEPVRRVVNLASAANAPGRFIGQSPDPAAPRPQDALGTVQVEPVRQSARAYAERNFGDQGVNLKVILAPSVALVLFDPADLKLLEQELNSIWSLPSGKGIRFEFTDPTSGLAYFNNARRTGDFHIVFDTFEYGHNRLRYISFTAPGSPLNDLGINVFTRSQTADWMSQGNQGRLDFLKATAAEFPFAVVGHFPKRLLLSTNVSPYDGDCPDHSRPPVLDKLWRWTRKGGR